MIGMAASIFGDIPYSEAATDGIDNAVLDDQAAVYAAVQTLLDNAIADLGSAAGSPPGAADLNFGRDAASWTAVAYTLKARFHMHWAEANPSAYADALAAAQNGIADVAGSWKAIHTSDANENNLWFQFQRDRSGYISAGDFLVPLMIADSDPRLPMWYEDPAVPRTSLLSPSGYGSPTFNFPIVSCAENAFIMAEALFAAVNEAGAISAAQERSNLSARRVGRGSFRKGDGHRGSDRRCAPGRNHGPEVHRVVPEYGGVQRLQAYLPARHHGASARHARPPLLRTG